MQTIPASLGQILGIGVTGVPATAELSGGQRPTVAPGAIENIFESNQFRLVPDEVNNSLLLLATQSEYRTIELALKKLDVPPKQVMIEAILAEVSLTDDLQYGVQWFFQTGGNQFTFSEVASGEVAPKFPGFSYFYSGSADAQAALSALASVTDVKVLSSPKLMVVNNQTASLQVGDQVPVATQTAVAVTDINAPIVNSVQFRDTGVILNVTPRINEGGLVMLEIVQEVSSVIPTTTSAINSPTIQQRRFSSTIIVHDGDTVVLGGLIRETISKGRSGIPILKDIPLLGALFRSSSRSIGRTELIVLIRPRIAGSAQEARMTLDYLSKQFHNLRLADLANAVPNQ